MLRLAESDAGWAVKLVRDYDPSLPELPGDADRLTQAVWNLVRNAIEAGAASVMPAGSPIGSGQGVLNPLNISLCLELLKDGDPTYPVIVDAGLGAPSHAAEALELGADAVLINTAIAVAEDPVAMARAFNMAVEAGRLARESGLPAQQESAIPTSPLTAFLQNA